MRRVLLTSLGYLIFSFLVILCYTFFVDSTPLPPLLPGQEQRYQLYRSLNLLCQWLPAILCTSFLVSYTILFSKTDKKILIRFSPYMMGQFRTVALSALVGSILIMCSMEVGTPLLRRNMGAMAEAESLFKEYYSAAQDYSGRGQYVIAIQYAKAAEALLPTSEEASELRRDLEIQIEGSILEDLAVAAPPPVVAPPPAPASDVHLSDRNASSYQFLQLATQCSENSDWINAHYYAMLAQQTALQGSAIITDAKVMAANAWNQLEEPIWLNDRELEQLYRRKKDAYSQLMQGNAVDAYYDFKELSQLYPDDEDILRYYAATIEKIEQQYFFLDEIPISQGIEDRRNLSFRIGSADGSESIIFARGLSSVVNTGGMIQYARDLSIYEFDKQGLFQGSLYVPYAKIIAQPAASLDEGLQRELEQRGISTESSMVPLLVLESLDRLNKGTVSSPVYTSPHGEGVVEQRLRPLPIEYADFLLLKNASYNPDEMALMDVIQMTMKAREYGYSQEVYGQAACSRVSKPIFYLVVFIYLACFGWNYRILNGGRFRLAWIPSLPIMTCVFFIIIEIAKYSQRLLNYGLFGLLGIAAIPVIFIISIVLVFFASVSFVTRRSE